MFNIRSAFEGLLVFVIIIAVSALIVMAALFLSTIMSPAVAGILTILSVVFLLGGFLG